MLIARSIDLRSYGDFVFGFQLGQVLATLAALGAAFYLAKHFGACDDAPSGRVSTFRAHNLFLLRGGIGLLLAWFLMHLAFGRGIASASFGISVANFVIVMLMAFLTATGRAPVGNALQAGRSLMLCLAVLVSMGTFTRMALFDLLLVGAWVYSLLVFWIFARRYSFKPSAKLGHEHRNFAWQHLFSVLLTGADVAILRFTVESEELAIYGVALFLSNIASFALYAVNANYTSKISRAVQADDSASAQKLLTHAARVNTLLSLPFLVGLAIFAMNLTVFYGDEYSGSRAIFFVLLSGQLVNVFVGSVALVANVSGKEAAIARLVWQSLAFKLIVGAAASLYWGGMGMAAVAAVANAAWNIRALHLVMSDLRLNTTVLAFLNRS